MHFAVDAHAIGRRLTGNEVYVRSLLEGFAALDHHSRVTAYYCAPEAPARIPARFHARRVAANPFLRLGFDLSRKLAEDRPDLVHVQYTAPLNCPVPVVASVHDISFLEHPEFFPSSRSWQLSLTVERTVRRAVRVLTPSEFSRQTVLRAYGLPPEKVVAIPIAASPQFRVVQPDLSRQRVHERFGLRAPYVLCVGDLQPRKNQIGLIAAFHRLAGAEPQLPHHLVFAGKEGFFGDRVRAAARGDGLGDRIHFTGFVSDDELVDLYCAADAMVFPSRYEGFGLPVVEAMACGCPVACSNTTALPEVANATALLFDPRETEAMSGAMRDLLVDAELRARMGRLGLQRAASFSWQETARRTMEVYREVAGLAAGPAHAAGVRAARS
jgi:glycosyltransferase involved in cell wall biosynthesis